MAFDGEDRGTPALHALEPVMDLEKFGVQAGITIAPVKKCPMLRGLGDFLKRSTLQASVCRQSRMTPAPRRAPAQFHRAPQHPSVFDYSAASNGCTARAGYWRRQQGRLPSRPSDVPCSRHNAGAAPYSSADLRSVALMVQGRLQIGG